MSELSRRDFLKLAAAGLLTTAAVDQWEQIKTFFGQPKNKQEGGSDLGKFEPTLIHGIEVYGLNGPITTNLDVLTLYALKDIQFADRQGIKITNKTEQRKQLLDPNTRYLEVVVRKSAYESFTANAGKTGVDFVEWAEAHMELSNLFMSEAKPPTRIKGILKRVLVVDDILTKTLWNEEASKKSGGDSLDAAWRRTYGGAFPVDIDTSWAIANDDRESSGISNYWIVNNADKKMTLSRAIPKQSSLFQSFIFDQQHGALGNYKGVKIDMSMIHEWVHYLFSLPDEYTQDVYDYGKSDFKRYLYSTGSYAIPYFSPYLSFLANKNIAFKVRSLDEANFKDHPSKVDIILKDPAQSFDSVEIRRVRLLDNSDRGDKAYPPNADSFSPGNSISMAETLFQGDSNSWLVSALVGRERKSIFVPISILNIAALAGNSSVNLEINFLPIPEGSTFQTQEVVPKDESELDSFVNLVKSRGMVPYAKLKIPNSTVVFIWYLSNRLDTFYG